MTGSYNPQLVALSFLIATLASYAALDLAGRVTAASGWARIAWLMGGACVMGLGIWSMHFIGMLAFHLPVPIAYSLPLMSLSVVVAIAASLLALLVVSRADLSLKTLLQAGVIMGLAIAGMHYIGMASMYMRAAQSYSAPIVALSILIAMVASTAALWLAYTFRSSINAKRWHALRLAASAVMGGAIAGMHYTAMAGASFTAAASPGVPHGQILATEQLATTIAIGTFFMIALTLTGAVVDRALQSRAAINAKLLDQAEQLKNKYREASSLAAELEKANVDLQAALKSAQESSEAAERSAQALRASEEKLRHSQRMEAIGNLAGGIAHDFNNLLTAMRLNTELLATDNELDRKKDLDELMRAINHAASLTRQLLAYGRRQMLNPVNLSLNTVIERMETMLRRLISESIEIRFDLDPDLGVTHVDQGQVEQVLTNLVINASHAMPRGGRIIIQTRNVRCPETSLEEGASPDNVMMAVIDNGHGMKREVRERAFEPFFTTRGKGAGSGLGLSTVYGIVKQSGGDIELDSAWGSGTTVRVYLPRVFDAAPDETEVASTPTLPMGKERILLVEDQEVVCSAARRILQAQGYWVVDAPDGVEALEKYDQANGDFDLILTDLVMPRMGGLELAKTLRKNQAGCAIIYMTGYSTESLSSQDQETPLIPKPFSAADLLGAVRKALDERAESKAGEEDLFQSLRQVRLA